jgi:CelD/BcsL family acetyltransferase involved in cellulose biosynthesis
MTAIEAEDMAEPRRRHLAALSDAIQRLDLAISCRLLGPTGSMLRVAGNTTGRRIMVLASPTSDGWSFLWSGGGMADATDPAAAARQIAAAVAGPISDDVPDVGV